MTINRTREDVLDVGTGDTARLPALKTDGPRDSGGLLDSTESWKIGPAQQHDLEREAELGTLRSNLASMAESRSYLESCLRSLTASLRELEERLLAKASQTTNLERELQARDVQLASLKHEREAQAAELARVTAALADGAQRIAALQMELVEQQRHAAAEIDALEARLDQADRDRDQALAGLQVAEERIRAAEVALRDRDGHIERLGASERDQKARADSFAQRLADRDGLIQRLEQEAESSAAVLDKIQANLARMDRDDGVQPRDVVARLFVRNDGNTDIVQVLGRRTLVGRAADCQLRIDAEFISRRHALVTVTPEETVIEDLNSTNGVFVNGTRVARRRLAEGDAITIGRLVFRYVLKPVPERGA